MSTLVKLNNVSVDFGEKRVLDSINLTLEKGKITTLIGPNGAGKSTLVKVILGLHNQYDGSINRLKSLKIGYVPQKLKLNDSLPLDVKRFLKMSGKFSAQELTEALRLVGGEHLMHNNMHQLSGGENQRVLIARSLLRRPDLLVLDEPAQGVDIQGQIDLYNLIDAIRHRFGCSVFMVSHDLHLVMAKTDNVICLHHHICCSGAPADITQHPSYIALFGSATKESLAFYHHQHDHHHHDLSGQAVKGDADSCSHHSHGHRHD
ncbi:MULTISPECIES: zinc ABC transporter ATP-binding protein ZnuC [Vibrio]|uniref:Zinc ABC transporter ATP-binding protein ZnuC n=2 Tax=Vibrio TaxID=662 RepID=A0A1E5DBB9_9VIBR|nr:MULTISPECIES: zinc ABC transporter ATP-binding protein ZnuC [Vibrio]MDN3698742.1 zinc ABC transporter ATP-binding protein ZnuC [Vibrio cortegadensis]NOH83376.1 zinc ABC transporter ATP-binding protein ZnuC [Vibrio sp. 03-59-1]OEE81089.1 zinc ABC transporter ATP-binding protein ZnuC [Vibrio genomosp. F6 str. FF-238]